MSKTCGVSLQASIEIFEAAAKVAEAKLAEVQGLDSVKASMEAARESLRALGPKPKEATR